MTPISVAEAAAILNVSQRVIRDYVGQGRLHAYRIAGVKLIRLDRDQVERLLVPIGREAS